MASEVRPVIDQRMRRSLKILIVNTLYPPDIMGGAEVSVSLLAEAFMRNGHHVAVVSLQKAGDVSVGDRNGIRTYRVQIDNAYWPFGQDRKPPRLDRLRWHLRDTWNRRAAKRFGAILDSEQPDVVHTNNLTGFSVSLWAEAKRRNIRIVHTLRDYSLICKRSTLFSKGATCDQRCLSCSTMTMPHLYASRMVDAVVSNSQYVLDRHLKLGFFPNVPHRVIYNIADSSVRPAPPSSDADMTFGFIGRIEPEKGIDVVLKAVSLLPEQGWQLKIAGKGLEAYERELRGRYDNPKIKWLGFVKPAEFYSTVDICLISSVWPEPLPRTLIESINAGRATICSTAGGIPEISHFSKTLGSYEPSDFRGLAELMKQAISEAPKWKTAFPPRPEFSASFTPEAVTRQYLDVYLKGTSNTDGDK
jgi:glycosyltransferase involved in cell wall biosynthesis